MNFEDLLPTSYADPRRARIAADLSDAAAMIDTQIEEVQYRAAEMNIPPSRLCDATGALMLSPLLVARAQVLLAMTLNEHAS